MLNVGRVGACGVLMMFMNLQNHRNLKADFYDRMIAISSEMCLKFKWILLVENLMKLLMKLL